MILNGDNDIGIFMRSAEGITKTSTFKEYHDRIHTYFPMKKIYQGGYLWSLKEDNKIWKTFLYSSDIRFSSIHKMLQLWNVNYDSSGSKNFIPSSENYLTMSYNSSDLITIWVLFRISLQLHWSSFKCNLHIWNEYLSYD